MSKGASTIRAAFPVRRDRWCSDSETSPMAGLSRFCLTLASYLRNAFVHTHIVIKLGRFLTLNN